MRSRMKQMKQSSHQNSHLAAIEQPTIDQEIATLSPSEKPSKLSMENQDKQPSEKPTNRHQIAFRSPRDSQPVASKSPLTKKEEKEEEKRAAAAYSRTFYKCLDGLDLSDQEKRSLMCYSEHRVAHAVGICEKKAKRRQSHRAVDVGLSTAYLPELPTRKSKKYDSSAKACLGVQPVSQQQWLCCSSKAE